jgi:hypothetical protein
METIMSNRVLRLRRLRGFEATFSVFYTIVFLMATWQSLWPVHSQAASAPPEDGSGDVVTCSGLSVTILGTPGDDIIMGTEGPDVIEGLEGNDIIDGLGGNDVICGGLGKDILYAGTGDDKLHGQGGDDILYGEAGNDRLDGGGGDDTLNGGAGDDTLLADDGEDILDGGDGEDTCDGGTHVVGDTAVNCETLTNVTVEFSSPLNISQSPGDSMRPNVAANHAGDLFAVWSDDTTGTSRIMFSRSLDGGTMWSAPVLISPTQGVSRKARVAAGPSGEAYVVWQHETAWSAGKATAADIAFRRSLDGGTTWSAVLNLSNTAMTFSAFPSIAVQENGSLNVVWAEEIPDTGNVYFARSLDRGETWSNPVDISNEGPTDE